MLEILFHLFKHLFTSVFGSYNSLNKNPFFS